MAKNYEETYRRSEAQRDNDNLSSSRSSVSPSPPPPPSRTVLHGHVSQESACIIHDYPMGRVYKCVKRIWVETAEKMKGKNAGKAGLQRAVYQTTGQTFNYKYTDILKEGECNASLKAAVEYFWSMHNAGEIKWNAPHLGVYHGLVLLVNDDVKQDAEEVNKRYMVGRLHVEVEALSPHPWAEHIENFRKKWDEQLDEGQRKVFERLASKA